MIWNRFTCAGLLLTLLIAGLLRAEASNPAKSEQQEQRGLERRANDPIVKLAADRSEPHFEPVPDDSSTPGREPIRMRVRQRDTWAVPGLKDVEISMGDISEGRVTLAVYGAERRVLLDPVLLREGDAVDVAIDGKSYVVRVLDVEDARIGRDFATLSIAPAEAAPEDAAGAGIRVALSAAPETDFRKVQDVIASLNALRITDVKQSAGRKGSGVSAEIRAGGATPSRLIAAVVEALLNRGVDRLSVEIEQLTVIRQRKPQPVQ
jgi:hypothetical protein